MKLNPEFIFLPIDKKIIAWNYATHLQYELTAPYLIRYIEIIYRTDEYDPCKKIDADLFEAGLIQKFDTNCVDWGWDSLSKIFHFGTKDLGGKNKPTNEADWASEYINHCENVLSTPLEQLSRIGPHQKISLPDCQELSESLATVFASRKTCRDFFKNEATLEQLSTVLHATLGIQRKETLENIPEAFSTRRCSPTGGGMSSTNVFVYVNAVVSLAPGFYEYDPTDHSIILINSNFVRLGNLTNGQHFSDSAAFALFFTSRLNRLWWKYSHSRAYRMALIEIGHHSQTALLAISAVGLESWLTGALDDSLVEEKLSLTGSSEQVFFCVAAGHGSGSPLSESLLNRLKGHES
jgi:SagB-type dehydrogenase family enzyme